MQIRYLYIIVVAAALLLGAYYVLQPAIQPKPAAPPLPGTHPESGELPDNTYSLPESSAGDGQPVRAVLDISVHTIEGLRVLLDRAEKLAMRPQVKGEDDRIVLVLHGPEVEFFSIKNYGKYKDIVDQAARLDAFDVVDVRICQTMMEQKGIERDDIPAFIEQVPLGSRELDRLIRDGYVAF